MFYDPRPDLLYLNERIDKLEASMKAIVKALQLFLENTNYNRRLIMDVSILKCKDCGAILVVNNNDLWATKKCPKCESADIQNVDDVFDFTEVIGEEEDVK